MNFKWHYLLFCKDDFQDFYSILSCLALVHFYFIFSISFLNAGNNPQKYFYDLLIPHNFKLEGHFIEYIYNALIVQYSCFHEKTLIAAS